MPLTPRTASASSRPPTEAEALTWWPGWRPSGSDVAGRAAPSGDEVPPNGSTRRRAEILCLTAIAVKTAFALALLPVVPSLIGTHPVLLEALRGSTSAMAAGGAFACVGQASLVLAVLAPLPTLLFVTPFFWWAGRLWGPKVVATLAGGNPKADQWAQRSAAHLERFGGLAVALAPLPSDPLRDHLRRRGLDRDDPAPLHDL